MAANDGLFQMAFHHSPAMQSVVRASDGTIVEVNETFLQKMGRTRDQVIGKTPFELGAWIDPNQLVEYRAEMERNGCVLGREVRLRTGSGEILTVLLYSHSLEVNGVLHYLSAGVDISPRKEAEANLRESERRLRESEARFSTAFQTNPVLMTMVRLDGGKFVEVNEAFIRLLGWERSELIGRDSSELRLWVHPAARASFFERLAREGEVLNVEAEFCTRHGTIHTMQVSAKIIEINREPHLITFGLDITEQKRAEQVLREAEARTRALYESISAAVAVQDETGFVQINSASLKLFGSNTPGEILGKHPSDFSAPRQPDGENSAVAARRHVEAAFANGSERFEWLARRMDGTIFPVEVTLTAVQLQGRPALQAVIIDLTERKRAEAELQKALAQERELSQLKSDFVSLVSHEFRTPLEIILSSADNLQRYHDRLPQEKRQQLLQTIHKSVRRMAGMMEEVLVLGRVESGKTEFRPASFDLLAFCQRLTSEIQTATSRRCPVELQGNGVRRSAYGDENLLRHILSNLLSNAVKYSAEGQPVLLAVAKKGTNAIFQVIDRGCGIPATDQARLFQAFHRGHNVRQIPGTGLGLVIVRRCVELHGGDVQCKSVEGKGTTFTITLPLFVKPAVETTDQINALSQIL